MLSAFLALKYSQLVTLQIHEDIQKWNIFRPPRLCTAIGIGIGNWAKRELVRGLSIATKNILPSFAMLTLNLPADALDTTVLEWRLEDVVVVENAIWDTAEGADAAAEGPAGLEDDEEDHRKRTHASRDVLDGEVNTRGMAMIALPLLFN